MYIKVEHKSKKLQVKPAYHGLSGLFWCHGQVCYFHSKVMSGKSLLMEVVLDCSDKDLFALPVFLLQRNTQNNKGLLSKDRRLI